MKLKLLGSFEIRNIVPVSTEPQGIVGEMHILRRSGWRGGPSYQFHPNATGWALGLRPGTSTKVRALLATLVPR